MDRYSQASKRVVGVYRTELNELDMSIRNTVYDELVKESSANTRICRITRNHAIYASRIR